MRNLEAWQTAQCACRLPAAGEWCADTTIKYFMYYSPHAKYFEARETGNLMWLIRCAGTCCPLMRAISISWIGVGPEDTIAEVVPATNLGAAAARDRGSATQLARLAWQVVLADGCFRALLRSHAGAFPFRI